MKNTNEQFKNILRSFFSIILVLASTFVFAHTWIKSYNPVIVIPYVKMGNLFFYAVYLLIFSFFLYSFDGLKYGTYRTINIIIAQTLACVAAAFVVYIQIVLLSARLVTVLPLAKMVITDFAIILIIAFLGNFLFKKLFPAKKTLIIYDEYSPDTFILKLNERKDKFSVKSIVNVDIGIEKIEEYIQQAECVIIYDVHSEKRNKLLKVCFENNIRTYTTTKVSDVLMRGAETLHLFDTPLLLYRNIGLTFEQRFIKRFSDIIISAVMLIIVSPLLLLTALAIKLSDGGPIFFRQARCTLNGKIFYIHKFRSMVVDAEKDGARPVQKNDNRITAVGKFIRATRIDELPQLIDILVGNMSLVGPRPERIEHIKQYTEEIPEFQYRLKVRGGLTGYAQLYGKYNTSPYDKLQLDLMYIENYSFLLDLRLLLMTVKVLFMRESTEGFNEQTSLEIEKKSKENND